MLLKLTRFIVASTPATSVIQSMLVRILLLLLSLSCGIITARSLGPTGRGEQSAILLWPYVVTGVVGFGVAPAVSYYTSRTLGASAAIQGGLLSAASLILIVTGAVGATIGSLVVPRYLMNFPHEVIRAAQIIMLFSPAVLLGYLFQVTLEARGDFTNSNKSRIFAAGLTFLCLLLLRFTGYLTPFNATLALYVPIGIQTIWLGCDLRESLSLDFRDFRCNSRTLLSYGLRIYGNEVFYTFSSQIDQAMIIAFLAPSALGLYAIALTASRTLNNLLQAITMVLFPKASSLQADSAVDLVGRMARISVCLTLMASCTLFALIPYLLPLLYGNAFLSAAAITRILIFEAFLMGAASLFAQAFSATGRPGVVTILQAAWIIISLVSLVMFVPRFGIIGAAFALALASLVRLIATLLCYPFVLHKPVPSLIPSFADLEYLLRKIQTVWSIAL